MVGRWVRKNNKIISRMFQLVTSITPLINFDAFVFLQFDTRITIKKEQGEVYHNPLFK